MYIKDLTNNELKNVSGGGFNVGLWLGIAAGVSFVIGFLDGLVRPMPCR